MKISRETIAKQLLGSKLKRKILAFLLSDQEPLSERELARLFSVSHTAVNKSMRQLQDMNIVTSRRIGTALTWQINKKSLAYPHVKAFMEASSLSPLEQIKTSLKKDIETINKITNIYGGSKMSKQEPIKAVYIFGSVAEGTASAESDIDILIITGVGHNKNKIKELLLETTGSDILEKTGNKPSFHIYDEKAVKNNKPEWLKNALGKGIRVV